jgi:hypothetical protein
MEDRFRGRTDISYKFESVLFLFRVLGYRHIDMKFDDQLEGVMLKPDLVMAERRESQKHA